jgi:hypothetical protein
MENIGKTFINRWVRHGNPNFRISGFLQLGGFGEDVGRELLRGAYAPLDLQLTPAHQTGTVTLTILEQKKEGLNHQRRSL